MTKTLHKDIEATISNLYETKYFEALSELIANELDTTKTWLLNKQLTADEIRFYQGRAEGLGVILLQIKAIHDEHMKAPT
jgi:indole-3-glycerol phosphate synthase